LSWGAGMAGLATVRALSRAPVTVQLIDAHNYTTFPPLLFQVATCFISPAEVARPIRALLHRSPAATFRMGRVAGVDWPGQQVLLDDDTAVRFDYLVLAPGVVPAFADVPGAAAHAIPLKQVTDAARLRNRLLRSFETAAAHEGEVNPGRHQRRGGWRGPGRCGVVRLRRQLLVSLTVRGRLPAA
jgi:NADH:ubiquinone reductase (H+-translocating)